MRALALVLLLTGCATAVPQGSDEAAFIAEGARRVAPDARADLLVGNTVVGDQFRIHYATDGTKRIETGAIVIERRWRIAADGTFCEELAASAVEVCADSGRLYEKDGVYRAFRPDGSASPLSFRITAGAPG